MSYMFSQYRKGQTVGPVEVLVGLLIATGVVAFVIAVVVIALIVWGIRRAYYSFKGDEYRPLIGGKVQHEYEHQDVSNGATSASIERVLRRYQRVETVGKYAHAGISALESERKKTANFYGVLEGKFPKTSLSYSKFSVAAEATHDTILRNCASLANRVQVFDFVEYRRVERAHRNSKYRTDVAPSEMQLEKYNLMHASIDEMDAIIASNDKLLLELDKLTAEIGLIDNVDTTERSEEIVEEIRTLIDETKYYRQ